MDTKKELSWRAYVIAQWELKSMVAAQQKVHDLFNSKVSDPKLVYEFNLFDKSVTQKLWSARYYYEKMSELDIRRFWEQYTTTNIQSADLRTSTTQSQGLNLERYCSHAHLLLDGFLVNSSSVLDTFAHEILTIYEFHQRPSKLYIGTIKKSLVRFHPNSKLGALLDKRLSRPWFIQFQCFRNCTTHVSLIGLDGVKVKYDHITGQVMGSKIRLPDDPYGRPFTYRKNIEATRYCKSILRNIETLVANAHESILADIRRSNNNIPVPII